MVVINNIFKRESTIFTHILRWWLKIYRKPWVPNPSGRKDNRSNGITVGVNHNIIDEVWLDQFIGKIEFWSHSIIKVRPDSKSTKFRIYTKQRISLKKVTDIFSETFPGCIVKPYLFYNKTHTVDVRTKDPVTWRDFIWKTVNALRKHLWWNLNLENL